MKIKRDIFFILFAIISFPLIGMEAEDNPGATLYLAKYGKKTNEELFEIVKDASKAEQDAILQILTGRGLPAPGSQLTAVPVSSDNNSWINDENIINIIGITALLIVGWTTIEACIAYKKLSKEEWKESNGFAKKSALLAYKTGSAMLSRPGQVIVLGKDIINKIVPNRQSCDKRL
jgi:hypothetical protein